MNLNFEKALYSLLVWIDKSSPFLLKNPSVQELVEGKPVILGWLEKWKGSGVRLCEPDRHEIDPDI